MYSRVRRAVNFARWVPGAQASTNLRQEGIWASRAIAPGTVILIFGSRDLPSGSMNGSVRRSSAGIVNVLYGINAACNRGARNVHGRRLRCPSRSMFAISLPVNRPSDVRE